MSYFIGLNGTNGAVIAAPDGAITARTGSPVYDTSQFLEGTSSGSFNHSTASTCIRCNIAGTTKTHSGTMLVRAPAIPSTHIRLVTTGDLANTVTVWNIRLTDSGKVDLANASTTRTVIGTVSFPLNQWFRLSWQHDYTVTTAPVLTVRLYSNPNAAVGSYDEEITWTFTGSTNAFDRTNYGLVGAAGAGSTRAVWLDAIDVQDGLLWIDPNPSVDKIGTDTWAMVISEARQMDVFVSRTDTSALTVADSRSIEAGLSRTDTSAVAISESQSTQAQLSRTDTSALSIAESRSQDVSLTRTDTAALSIADSRSIIALVTRSDTGALSIAESMSLSSFLAAVDSGSIAIAEDNDLSVEVARTDSFTISISESGSVGGMQTLRVYWDGIWHTGELKIYMDGEWLPVTIHFRKDNTWS